MAAKAGYIDQKIADYFVMAMIQQLAPELAEQLQQPELGQMQQSELGQMQENLPEETDKLFALSQMMNGQQNNQGGVLTQAATESLMRGMSPAI